MNDDGAELSERRPERSRLYPWYDSVWLTKYEMAKAIIRTVRPDGLAEFIDAFRVFHTRSDFKARLLERPFDDAVAVLQMLFLHAAYCVSDVSSSVQFQRS